MNRSIVVYEESCITTIALNAGMLALQAFLIICLLVSTVFVGES